MNGNWILSDESLNSHGLIIKTNGIDIEAFKENPVMLFNHDINQVIGKWTNVQKLGDKLIAEPEFDVEDPNATMVAKKIDKGLIKGCSIGILVEEVLPDENMNLVVLSSKLKECSITALPSNTNAVKLYYNINGVEQLMTKDELVTFSLKNKTINMSELENKDVEDVITNDNVDTTEETITETETNETEETTDVVESTESTEVIEESVIEATDATTDETEEEVIVEKVEDVVELSLTDRMLKLLNVSVSDNQKVENVILLTIQGLQSKVKEYDEIIEKQKKSEIEKYVDLNIASGKIKIKKEEALSLATSNFDTFKSLIDGFKVQVKLSDTIKEVEIKDEKRAWSFRDWEVKDPKGLAQMKENNITLFDKLYTDFYGKK